MNDPLTSLGAPSRLSSPHSDASKSEVSSGHPFNDFKFEFEAIRYFIDSLDFGPPSRLMRLLAFIIKSPPISLVHPAKLSMLFCDKAKSPPTISGEPSRLYRPFSLPIKDPFTVLGPPFREVIKLLEKTKSPSITSGDPDSDSSEHPEQ